MDVYGRRACVWVSERAGAEVGTCVLALVLVSVCVTWLYYRTAGGGRSPPHRPLSFEYSPRLIYNGTLSGVVTSLSHMGLSCSWDVF